MLLKDLFILLGLVTVLVIVFGKLYFFKKDDTMFVSNYVASIAAMFGAYSILGLFWVFSFSSLSLKLLMLFFALSPFILGQLATYKYEKIFTHCQVILLITSILFVILYS